MIRKPFFAQPLKRIRRSPRLVSSASKELRSGTMHALGHGKRLFPALDGAWSRNNRKPGAADRSRGPGKTNHRVVFFNVPAHQLVGL